MSKLKIVHTLDEKSDDKKNKTQFIKKSLSAYSTEILNEDIGSQWNSIAKDIFNGDGEK